jgi:hypothetical protein
MKWVLWTTAGVALIALLGFLREVFRNDDVMTPRWLVDHGMYANTPRHDPDDPSRLQLLRKIARAQQGEDILGPR